MIRVETTPITVLIVDDHPLIRDGLTSILAIEDDIHVIGQCATGEEALQQIHRLHPSVVILDINLPTLNGIQVLRRVKAEQQPTAIVVLTAYHDAEQELHAIRAGADAYCRKDIEPGELIETIRAVARGEYRIDSELLDVNGVQDWISEHLDSLSGLNALDPADHYQPLSPREMEILQFVTNGMSNKEIARRLDISQQTVKNHMTSILKKMNVQDRTQAAVTAIQHGWVRLPPFQREMTRSVSGKAR